MLHFGFCLVYQDKEERYKHNTEYNGKYHSEENTRTDGLTARRARSACQHHRKHSQYKGEGSHQDRPETELGSMDGRLYQVSSLVNLHLGKLHNQNGILCRKPGKESNTAIGTVQLSYCAAKKRNTKRNTSVSTRPVCPPAFFS